MGSMALRNYCASMATYNKTMSAKNDFRFSRYFVFQMRVGFDGRVSPGLVVTVELSVIHLVWFTFFSLAKIMWLRSGLRAGLSRRRALIKFLCSCL